MGSFFQSLCILKTVFFFPPLRNTTLLLSTVGGGGRALLPHSGFVVSGHRQDYPKPQFSGCQAFNQWFQWRCKSLSNKRPWTGGGIVNTLKNNPKGLIVTQMYLIKSEKINWTSGLKFSAAGTLTRLWSLLRSLRRGYSGRETERQGHGPRRVRGWTRAVGMERDEVFTRGLHLGEGTREELVEKGSGQRWSRVCRTARRG